MWRVSNAKFLKQCDSSTNRFLASACWDEVVEMRGRFPVGVGQCPQLGAAHVYTVGQMGGASQTTLNINQIPDHTHAVDNVVRGQAAWGSFPSTAVQMANEGWVAISGYQTSHGVHERSATGTQPIENRPPFIGVYFFRRSTHQC